MKNNELKNMFGIVIMLIVMMVLMIKYEAIISVVGLGLFIIITVTTGVILLGLVLPSTNEEDC